MSNTELKLTLDEEMVALLPFYVSGGLDDHDIERVERWLETSQFGNEALRQALAEHAEVVAGNEAIAPPAQALGSVMEKIRLEPQPKPAGSIMPGVLQGLLDRLKAAPVEFAWGAVAALMLLTVVQSGMLLQRTDPEKFVVSSGGEQQIRGRIALVRFADNANINEIGKALEEVGATLIGGPRGRDTFLIRFNDEGEKLSVAHRLALLKAREDLIKMLIEKSGGE